MPQLMPLYWMFSFMLLIFILMMMTLVYGGCLLMQPESSPKGITLMKWLW